MLCPRLSPTLLIYPVHVILILIMFNYFYLITHLNYIGITLPFYLMSQPKLVFANELLNIA